MTIKELKLPTCENSQVLGHAVMACQCFCNKADRLVIVHYKNHKQPDTFYLCEDCAKHSIELAMSKDWSITVTPIYNF